MQRPLKSIRRSAELTEDGHGCLTRVPPGVVGHLAGVAPAGLLVVGAETLEDAGALRGGDVVFVRSEDLLAVFVPAHRDFGSSGVRALQRQRFPLLNRHVLQLLGEGCRL